MSGSSSTESKGPKAETKKGSTKGSTKGAKGKPKAEPGQLTPFQRALCERGVIEGHNSAEKWSKILKHPDNSLWYAYVERGVAVFETTKTGKKAKKPKDPLKPAKPSILFIFNKMSDKKFKGKDASKLAGEYFNESKEANSELYQRVEGLYNERLEQYAPVKEAYDATIYGKEPSKKELADYKELLADFLKHENGGAPEEDEEDAEDAEEAAESGKKRKAAEDTGDEPAKKKLKTKA